MKDSNLNPMAASPEKPDETLKISRRDLLQFRHDLNGGPLQRILGVASLIRMKPDDGRTATEWPDAIAQSVRRVTEMIGELVDGTFDPPVSMQREDIDLHTLVSEAADSIPWERAGHRLILRTDGPVRSIHGRRDRLRRMIENLLGNAVKYSPHGSAVELTVRNRAPHEVEIRVADEGDGVQTEWREAIFEDGFRMPHHRTSARGDGIGLAFCRQVAEEQGGRLCVEANSPWGSVFIVTLPAKRPK